MGIDLDGTTSASLEVGAPEIEITEKMTEAGMQVWRDYDSRFISPESLVEMIYEAMARAERAERPAAYPIDK